VENKRVYLSNREQYSRLINGWDILLLLMLCLALFALSWAGQQMATPYALGDQLAISLDISYLPGYASRTVLRMFIALLLSLVFTFTIGVLAAKNRRAEQVIIPAIDILQSVPVLSFLAITVTGFIHLFPNSLLGPECASIFAIFTAQVWNIALSFYQSLKTVPYDLREAAIMFQLSPWQRFWKIEVPCAMSGLLWNIMMSMSASWFFVVVSEALMVAHQDIRLPGVGSYIALAIEQHDLYALGAAMLTMVIVISLYDQLLFRPLLAWSEKFKLDDAAQDDAAQSWLLDWLRKSALIRRFNRRVDWLANRIVNLRALRTPSSTRSLELESGAVGRWAWIWNIGLLASLLVLGWMLARYVMLTVQLGELLHVVFLGAITGTRVIVLIALSSMLWIPVGVWIGQRPAIAQTLQPLVQFAAAFPANLLYPLVVIAIVRFHANVEIWLTPLMILGTQWYILFNVIAGASMIPRDLCLAADNFGVTGWQWWRRLALPAIFPYYITGAICAAGGAWNASIVAEWVSWGDTTLHATGLGEYIHVSTLDGDFHNLALGTGIMCVYVLLFNQLLWRPLYRRAEARFNYS
jgi:NitT/TauT family transport system permease protein